MLRLVERLVAICGLCLQGYWRIWQCFDKWVKYVGSYSRMQKIRECFNALQAMLWKRDRQR